jgi:hypothetical protein
MSMLPLVSMARFDDQPAEAAKAEPLSRTPAAKRFIANDPTYQAAVEAYATAPARKKAAHRLQMIEALQVALREYHRQHPISPAAEKTKQAELAAASAAYRQRPHQPVHIEYSEALNDGPTDSSCSDHSLPAACRDTK